MPLITIQALAPSNDLAVIQRLILDVQEAGAKAMASPPSNIWVIFEPIQPGYYVQAQDSHPPVVIIRANAGRTRETKTALAAAVAQAVGKGLAVRPENVWIHYQELPPEDVWFEGRWASTVRV